MPQGLCLSEETQVWERENAAVCRMREKYGEKAKILKLSQWKGIQRCWWTAADHEPKWAVVVRVAPRSRPGPSLGPSLQGRH